VIDARLCERAACISFRYYSKIDSTSSALLLAHEAQYSGRGNMADNMAATTAAAPATKSARTGHQQDERTAAEVRGVPAESGQATKLRPSVRMQLCRH
jgi:hypothetical protein